VYAEVVMLSRR